MRKILLSLIFVLLLSGCAEVNNLYDSIETIQDIETIDLIEDIPSNIPSKNHVFIVLGYALSEEGKMQDPLIGRLERVREAWEKNQNSMIIVSGGVPKNNKTEADMMAQWLIDRGIPVEKIIKENHSKTTIENALYSMEIVKDKDFQSATLVTSATHMRRAMMLFLETDITSIMSSHIVYIDEEVAGAFVENEAYLIRKDLDRLITVVNEERYIHNMKELRLE